MTQHKKSHQEIQRAKQVGDRGPSKENFHKKFNKQSKVGIGAPAKRISIRNSTSKASWGSGLGMNDHHTSAISYLDTNKLINVQLICIIIIHL